MSKKNPIVELGENLKNGIDTIANNAAMQFIETNNFKSEKFYEDYGCDCYRNKVSTAIKNYFDQSIQDYWIYGETKKYSEKFEVTFRQIVNPGGKGSSYLETTLGGTDIVISNKDQEVDLSYMVNRAYSVECDANQHFHDKLKNEIIGIETKVIHYKKVVEGLKDKEGKNIPADETQYFVTGNPRIVKENKNYSFKVNGNFTTNLEGQFLSDLARGCFILSKQNNVQHFFLFGLVIIAVKDEFTFVENNNRPLSCNDICDRLNNLKSELINTNNIFNKIYYKQTGKLYLPSRFQFCGTINIGVCKEVDYNKSPYLKIFPYYVVIKK